MVIFGGIGVIFGPGRGGSPGVIAVTCFKIASVVGSNSRGDIDNINDDDDDDDDDVDVDDDNVVSCPPFFLSFPPCLSFPSFRFDFSTSRPPTSLLSPSSTRRIMSLALSAVSLLPQGKISSNNRVRSKPRRTGVKKLIDK